MTDQFNKYSKEGMARQMGREDTMFSLGLEAFKDKLQAQKVSNDYSRSAAGKFVEKNLLDGLAEVIDESFAGVRGAGINARECHEVWKSLNNIPEYSKDSGRKTQKVFHLWDPHAVALITLRMLLDSCYMPIRDLGDFDKEARPDIRKLAVNIGGHIEGEFLIRKGYHYFPDGEFRPGFITRICKKAATANAGRDQALYARKRKLKDMHGFWAEKESPLAHTLAWEPWSRKTKEIVARKVMALIAANLKNTYGQSLFSDTITKGRRQFFGFSPFGEKWAERIDGKSGEHHFVPLPMLVEPRAHTRDTQGGYLDMNKATYQKHASRTFSGWLEPSDKLVDFANALQNVPYRINPFVADLLEKVYSKQGRAWKIGSFGPIPTKEDYDLDMPESLKHLPPGHEDLKEPKRRMNQQNDLFVQDTKIWKATLPKFMKIMTMSRKDDYFYIPTYMDWRGRCYFRKTGFSPQGTDHEKAVLEWAEPVVADDFTQNWLMMQITSCMGYDKVSTAMRVAKVLEIEEHLIRSVRDPLGYDWWRKQDKPWGLIAAAAEYVRLFVDEDPNRLTHARVNFDASSSGQQLIAGLTRDKITGSAVNITPGDEPRDIYGNVARKAREIAESMDWILPVMEKGEITGHVPVHTLQQLNRAASKSICMIAQYGAGTECRWKALQKFTQEKSEKLGIIPLTDKEAETIYKVLYSAALEAEMPALDDYIKFTRKATTEALSDGRADLLLPSADGSIVHQTYLEMVEDGVVRTANLGNLKYKTEHVNMVPVDKTRIDDQRRGTPPNLIHAQDRSVLSIALSELEFPFATVHDSVYGRPCKEMGEIKSRLLQAYYEVFTSEVLEKFITENGLEIEDHPIPYKNTYKPALIKEAGYAFS